MQIKAKCRKAVKKCKKKIKSLLSAPCKAKIWKADGTASGKMAAYYEKWGMGKRAGGKSGK